MWIKWAKIAIRQEARARSARATGLKDLTDGVARAIEVEEAVVCITAVRHCCTNLFDVWDEFLGLDDQGKLRQSDFTKAPVLADREYGERVQGSILSPRDEAVHHKERMTEVVPHDAYESNVGEVAQQYSLERSTKAVDFLLDIVLTPAISAPSDVLEEWSSKFAKTLDSLLLMREEGTEF